MPNDALIIATSPNSLTTERGDLPPDDPSPVVFCCFFRGVDVRQEFLLELRDIAAHYQPEADPNIQRGTTLERYARLTSSGNNSAAFTAAFQWYVGAMGCTYHAYSVRAETGPYKTACIVCFRSLQADEMKENIDRAIALAEESRLRVLETFGMPNALN